ncbi:MAG: hypothetical protein R2724_28685 [Bryobacterales bacterium]
MVEKRIEEEETRDNPKSVLGRAVGEAGFETVSTFWRMTRMKRAID